MNVDLVLRIAFVGVLLGALNLVLSKAGKEDIAWVTTLAGLAIVLAIVLTEIGNLFQSIRSVFGL